MYLFRHYQGFDYAHLVISRDGNWSFGHLEEPHSAVDALFPERFSPQLLEVVSQSFSELDVIIFILDREYLVAWKADSSELKEAMFIVVEVS